MSKKTNRFRTVTVIAFVIYLLILAWVVLFKANPNLLTVDLSARKESINLVPLQRSLGENGRLRLGDLFYNVLGFIPLGAFVSMLAKKRRLGNAILLALIISVVFEAAQYFLSLGTPDITDIITNTLGAVFGYFVWLFARLIFRSKTEPVLSTLALISELIAIGFYLKLLLSRG